MTQGMSQNMHGMMGCDGGGWFMMGTHLIVLVVLVLAGAALIKYLFFADRTVR